jgi:hypothetical protein
MTDEPSQPRPEPLKLFFSYASKDKKILEALHEHLMTLVQGKLFELWHDREISAGHEFDPVIREKLEQSDIVLLLLSPAFFGSKYIWEAEIPLAVELERKRKVRLIPVIARPCEWEATDLGKLIALPSERKPIVKWRDRDDAYLDVTRGVRKVAEEFRVERAREATEAAARAAVSSGPDFTRYWRDLLSRTEAIEIRGVSHAPGAGRVAQRYAIERIYTPLRARWLTGERDVDAQTSASSTLGFARGDGRARLAELLPQTKRLYIEGQPGSGKSTFLHFCAAMLARDALGQKLEVATANETWASRFLGLAPGSGARSPVLVKLASVADHLKDGTASSRERIVDVFTEESDKEGWGVGRENWREALVSGRLLLLLDGLDEAGDEALVERVIDVVRDAAREWKDTPIVVTSRPVGAASLRDAGFQGAEIEPFGPAEIEQFLEHWVDAIYVSEGTATGRSAEAARYLAKVQGAILDRANVRRLAANPVMLTALCVVHWNEGELPDGRSRVYRAVLRWLRTSRRELRQNAGFEEAYAEFAFPRLGLAMMEGNCGAEKNGRKLVRIDIEEAAEAIDGVTERYFPKFDPATRRRTSRCWLRFECLGSGIVEEPSSGRLRFWHLTFEEYLAAQQLALYSDDEAGKESDPAWWPIVRLHLDDTAWRETTEIFPCCLFDEGGPGRVDRLILRVFDHCLETEGLVKDARLVGILGRLLPPLEVLGYKLRPELRVRYEAACERTLRIFELEGAREVPVALRIEAAEALGKGGDPRLAHPHENLLEVPPLPGLRLGKFLVTVEEYRHFVEEGRGYETREYWVDEGWGFREKNEWESPDSWDEQLRTPNRPVVWVSWYEAMAYCRWISGQWGETVRLPTEPEWEAAARPEQGEFPWGEEEPSPERTNNRWTEVQTTPVGVFPAGAGPYGHLDFAGNVWEWCLDRMNFEERARGDPPHAMRGGSWFKGVRALRVGSRAWGFATFRSGGVGFRLGVPPARTPVC